MQELIEIFNHELKLGEATLSNDEGYMLKWAIFNAKTLLEKEKEQIVDAYDRGYKACDLDETLEINKTMFSGERYYEQTYNK